MKTRLVDLKWAPYTSLQLPESQLLHSAVKCVVTYASELSSGANIVWQDKRRLLRHYRSLTYLLQ